VLQIPKTTILRVDPASDFAKTQGFPKLSTFIADAVVKLLISPTHSRFNLSALELVERFGHVSRVLNLSFEVVSVAPGKTPVRGFWLKPFTKKAYSGSYADALSQALKITKEVVTTPYVPSYLLFSCPFSDSRYHRFVQENNQQVTEVYPGILTGAVAASGVSPLHPLSTSPFFVGVAAFAPSPLRVSDTQPGKKEDKPKEESTVLPDTVVVETPLAKTASHLNGNKRDSKGRPTSAKREK
jgi:hypothetical protein